MRAGLWRSIALMTLMTIASGARAAEPVTLDVFYAFPAFAKFHEPIAQEFMKRHPDIKIVFRAPAPTYDDGHQAMMRAALTHQLPDVYYSGYDLLEELVHALVKQNDLVDLGPLLAAEGYPAGNSVRIWRAQRDVISAVMRGDIAPNAGYEKIVKDTAAMMAQ